MKARAVLVATLVIGSLVGLSETAPASHRVIELDSTNTSDSWTGPAADGANQNYNSASGEPCTDTPTNPSSACEQTLLHLNAGVPVDAQVSLADDVAQDFDLYVYASDSSSNRGALVDSSANPQTLLEVAVISDAPANSYYLIQVVYFATTEEGGGYQGTAEITAEGDPPVPPSPDLPETVNYLHEDAPPPPPADPGTFDTTPPTSEEPSVATGAGFFTTVQWEGEVDQGTIRRLKIDIWQSAAIGQGTEEVHYNVALIVGDREYTFPHFTEPTTSDVPSRVMHTYTDDGTNPLPITVPAGPMTIEIGGRFVDAEGTYQIYYDSVNLASNFVLNPPPVPTKKPFPPDVDTPPGLQEFLASEPAQGWTSRSEPHIARSPLNPNILIAGSKFYNKADTDGNNVIDPLAEYEFKIGTYVSFDGGRTWTDLGQLRTCPMAEAGPDTWPDNTCYPADDPSMEGPEEGGEDFGEEYITSDVWIDFDDEGNAYVMVLDHPPYTTPFDPGTGEGNGWGMTLHRWDSVSPADVTGGNTWGPRMPINFYDNELTQSLLLDDKNTFSVNNAGPDQDGETGTLIACWGQVAADPVIGAGKQQEVCSFSNDKGETWSKPPVPISDVEPLVIGVHVIADTQDPETFYATWLQYATGGAGGDIGGENTPETLEFAVTTDGGVTWTRRPPVDFVIQIPRQFPGQLFRNLSIPIMAVGPNSELYIAIAQYLPAPDPDNDPDDRQADITIYKSTNGGQNWTGPVNITDDTEPGTNPNADQFQPYIVVTKSGQVDVAYFDRRLDVDTEEFPGNYYTDVFLSRSNDGGANWTDIRLTHDATDPEYNAPVSPSGLFFGDYQGLVADNCVAIPFFNDTHLANDDFLDPGPVRDPEFDDGMPSSPYQESITWRVPNTAEFGGNGMPDLHPRKITIEKIPRRGRPNLLAANIRNLECIDATNVVVRFFDNGQQIGSDKVIPLILAGRGKSATVNWTPRSAGPHTIRVVADPDGQIPETNEDNNSFSRTYAVRR
jgi:hypothetical protein